MERRFRILIADDEDYILDVLSDILNNNGYDTTCAQSGDETIELVKKHVFDTILLDLVLGEESGIDVMKGIRKINNDLPVIIISAHGSIKRAVEAIKEGASDFVEKPLEMNRILSIIKNTIEKYSLKKEILHLQMEVLNRYPIIGESPQTQKIRDEINLYASKNCSVLISGETGVGKENTARQLHGSSRKKRAFY